MSKKNIDLATMLMVFSTASIVPMSVNEKRAIRKELYSNYENARINSITLAETGLTLVEVIDRDIQILADHKQLLQRNIDGCKSGFARNFVPCMNKCVALMLGTVSTMTGIYAIGGSEWCKKAYHDGDLLTKFINWGVDKGFNWGLIKQNDYYSWIQARFDRVAAENANFTSVATSVPVATAVSTISALLLIKTLLGIYRHHGALDAYVQKAKNRFERDQAIIVQLKEIKQAI